MFKFTDTLKNHKLSLALALILVYLLGKDAVGYFFGINTFSGSASLPRAYDSSDSYMGSVSLGVPKPASFAITAPSMNTYEAAPTIAEARMVIEDTHLSLLVNNVEDSVSRIQIVAREQGGYMVNSHVSTPSEGGSGSISIRVPTSKHEATLTAIKAAGVKTVSESVAGQDVTDQYADLDARLATLNTTKAKFEAMLTNATTVAETLQVQREIISLQTQIDSIKGQQQYLKQSAELTKIAVDLSTDELALPYAPDQPWRPEVIFKTAVRSLIMSARSLANLAIWIAVYIPIWAPVVAAIYLIRRRKKNVVK